MEAAEQAVEGNADEEKEADEAPMERTYDIKREEKVAVLTDAEQNSPAVAKSAAASPVARAQGT